MSFSLFLNNILTDTAGLPDFSSVKYNFDWNNTPEWHGKYKVSVNFITRNFAVSGATIAMISTDIGASQFSYTPNSSNGTKNNRILGYVKPYVLGAAGNIFCDCNTNAPVIISSKPTNPYFTISLLNPDGTPFTSIGFTFYFLNIYFEAIP